MKPGLEFASKVCVCAHLVPSLYYMVHVLPVCVCVCVQLNAATSDEDIQRLLANPITADVMERCQVHSQLKVLLRDAFIHSISIYMLFPTYAHS